MKLKTIMFDIDGVLADFSMAALKAAHDKYGIAPRTSNEIQSWNWTELVTYDQLMNILDTCRHTPGFWLTPPLAPNIDDKTIYELMELVESQRVYFVTARMETKENKAMHHTHEWLFDNFNIEHANVIMTENKGDFAKLVDADFFIDDKWEHAHNVLWQTRGKTRCYLINRPYNHLDASHVGVRGIHRVDTVWEFIQEIRKEN